MELRSAPADARMQRNKLIYDELMLGKTPRAGLVPGKEAQQTAHGQAGASDKDRVRVSEARQRNKNTRENGSRAEQGAEQEGERQSEQGVPIHRCRDTERYDAILGADHFELRTFLQEVGAISTRWVRPADRRLPVTNRAVAQSHTTWPTYSPLLESGPSALEDIFTARSLQRIDAWKKAGEYDRMEHAKRKPGDRPHRNRQRELILTDADLQPWARGIVWDLRDLSNIRPVQELPAATKLNIPFIRSRAREMQWPDTRLVDELEFGWADYSPTTPRVSIFSPHHGSLQKVYDVTRTEIELEKAKGWSTWHPHPPFCPIRCIPNGSVPKPRSDKRRRCGDSSWPRDTLDEHGVPLAVNAQVTVNDTDPVQLPTHRDISSVIATYCTADVPVVLMKFDESGAYKQTAMAQSELWKQCFYWEGQFVSEDRLLYGGAFAPSCYCRWGALRKAMLDAMLTKHIRVTDPAVLAWMRHRRAQLGPREGSPFWTSIYIDDYMVICLGWEVAGQIRAVMQSFSEQTGIEFSWDKYEAEGKPSTVLNMLGIDFLTDTQQKRYPEDKRLFMQLQLRQAMKSEWMTRTELMSLMMRLRWMSDVMYYARYHLNSGFAMLRKGSKALHSRIKVTTHCYKDWQWILDALDKWDSVSMILEDDWMRGTQRGFASDASGWGFGGAMLLAGVYYLFRGEWSAEERAFLDINALELAAIVFASAMFGPYRRESRLILQTDNEASAHVINRGKASPVMSALLHQGELQWTACSLMVYAQHILGVTNTLPDVLSRPGMQHFDELVGSAPVVWLELPASVRCLTAEAVQLSKDRVVALGLTQTTGVHKEAVQRTSEGATPLCRQWSVGRPLWF